MLLVAIPRRRRQRRIHIRISGDHLFDRGRLSLAFGARDNELSLALFRARTPLRTLGLPTRGRLLPLLLRLRRQCCLCRLCRCRFL